METQKGREDIFGFQMQNDSEYAMRQREPVSLATTFIHKLCLTEVDLIERMARLYNGTTAIQPFIS